MTTIRQKELAFLQRMKLRFEDMADYRAVVKDMVKEGLISAAAADTVLSTPRPRRSTNTIISPDVLIAEVTKKVAGGKNRKVTPADDPCTPPPAYGGCAGGRSRC